MADSLTIPVRPVAPTNVRRATRLRARLARIRRAIARTLRADSGTHERLVAAKWEHIDQGIMRHGVTF